MKTIWITVSIVFASFFNIYGQHIGPLSGDSLSKMKLKNGGALIPILEDFDFDVYARIKGFIISYNYNNQYFETKVKGNVVPKEQLAILCKLKTGTRINFDNIEVDMPDGIVRRLNVHYYLKK